MTETDTPTPEETMANSDRRIAFWNGELIALKDLLTPGYSTCNNCPLRPRGNQPAKCPVYRAHTVDGTDPHCVIEEAMVLETVQMLERSGYSETAILTNFSLITNMLNLHRLQRAGQVIDYSDLGMEKEATELVNKYISMTTSANTQYIKALKELRATPKEDTKARVEVTNSTANYMKAMNDAKAIEEARQNKIPPSERE